MNGQPGRQTNHIGNFAFLRQLATALMALAASGAVLLLCLVVFSPQSAQYRAAASQADLDPRSIAGDELIVRLGKGRRDPGSGLTVTGLSGDNRAIATRDTHLQAEDYPFLQYTIAGRHPGQRLYLLWRTAAEPDRVSNARLYWQGDGPTNFHLAAHPEWRGRITEIGLDIYGDLREDPLVISNLTLLPASASGLLSTIWSEWRAFRGWTQKSINYQRGVTKSAILAPTPAAAAWAGLALLMLGGLRLLTGWRQGVACAAAVLIPWIALDLHWQSDIANQSRETRFLFAGKTQREKHLADRDSQLYQYATYLKEEVLPGPGARIFLLHDSSPMTYQRLKAQYYLLPHNVFNYDRFPREKAARPGDYLLVLGEVEGLEYRKKKRLLTWNNSSLRAKLVDRQPDGSLYRVVRPRKPGKKNG